MKKILFVVVLILVLFLTLSSLSTAADWVYYSSDNLDNASFYDRESISFPSKGVVRVWIKQLYSEKGKMNEITERTKSNLTIDGLNELSYALCLHEIKCDAKEDAIVTCTSYSNSGNTLNSFNISKDRLKWEPIYPDSISEALWKAVCKREGK
ncbi:MAG TPA: hypothetical protein PK125_08180 [Syntrophorhabdus sp.]|jgi:hypothetical protein|nr:MAG: hypothetical protein BWX92_01499 [Deltaproteobacteria bacterium ADurb.Bin135]HPB38124.1 hypothetical protein [Syntrophorhabdus sp.]HQB35258.1 hypothetical protein [Syntrophorhabdus sp.]HQP56601.1 hypothetical protein [Syntrophorhabdus sp.]